MSPETLRQLLRYDSTTGKLYWLPRDASYFKGGRKGSAASWNGRRAGKLALNADHGDGYLSGEIFRKSVYAHRAVWVLVYGEWPVDQIDHVNGVRSDNRLINLRSVDRPENGKNQARRYDNTSGVTGVGWDKHHKKWRVRIRVNDVLINIGRYINFDEAVAARKDAESKHCFHPNHGRAA